MRGLLTRRRALWALGAAGLVGLGADGARGDGIERAGVPGPRTPVDAATPVPSPAPTPTPTPTPTLRPAPWTAEPITTAEQPVRRLTELVPAPPPNTIALTIDDGPHPAWTPRVLDLLAEHDVQATFFIIGEQVREFPKIAKRIADSGHQICNHTMTHPTLSHASAKKIKREIVDAHDLIAQTTGIVPGFFRAPGGGWSPRVYDAIAEHDMLPIDWAVDPRDWARPGVGAIRRSMLGTKAGDILLCHDGGGDRAQTLAALKDVLPKLKKRGLIFTPL